MSTGVKITLALLGLSVASGLAYYFSTRQSGEDNTLTTGGNGSGSGDIVITKSFAEYEGKYVKNSAKSTDIYKVKLGMKEKLPQITAISFADKAIVIPDSILKSIPTK